MKKINEIIEKLSQITPGEWDCISTDEGHTIGMATALDKDRIGCEVQHQIEYNHGLWYEEDKEQFEEADANAEFIAAAPGDMRFLLEQYEKATELNREYIEFIEECREYFEMEYGECCWIKKIDTLLEKAKGDE